MFDKSRIITVTSNTRDSGGYALLGRSYIRNLINRGYRVRVESIPSPLEISEEEANYFRALGRGPNCNMPIIDEVVEARNPMAKTPPPYNSVKILNFLPMSNFPKPPGPLGKRFCATMMECEKVNASFINRCNKYYETVLTPTNFNANVFKECGLNIPVKVLPPGIDESYTPENAVEGMNFNYKVFGNSAPEEPEGYKFISVFRWSYRKGFDLLIKSYLNGFKRSDNVSLVIFSRHCAMNHDQRFRDAIEQDILELWNKYADINSPPIYWCSNVIPFQLMPSMYRVGDCYVNCSRGEGLSLTTLEASAMNLPVVCPNHTAFSDYVTNDNSYNFDVDEWVVCNTVPAWNRGFITTEFNHMRFPGFGDSKVEEVASLMRRAMENPEEAQLKNENMRKLIKEKYNWEKCTDLLETYLDEEN